MNSLSEVNVQQRLDNIEADVNTLSGVVSSSRLAVDSIVKDVNFTTTQTDKLQADIQQVGAATISLGETSMSASFPVVVANNQSNLPVEEQDTNHAGAMTNLANTAAVLSATAPARGILCAALESVGNSLEPLQLDTDENLLTSDRNLHNFLGGGAANDTKRIFCSKDRTSGSSQAATFNIFPAIDGEWKIDSFSISDNAYNVTSQTDTISFGETSGNTDDFVATMVHGYYLASELCSVIDTAMNSATGTPLGTYSTTYNSTSHGFSIAVSGGAASFQLDLAGGTSKLLGFDSGASGSFTSPVASIHPAQLITQSMVRLSLSNGGSQFSDQGSFYSSAIATNFRTAGFGSIAYAGHVSGVMTYSNDTTTIITIFNEQRNAWEPAEGCDWVLTLVKISA